MARWRQFRAILPGLIAVINIAYVGHWLSRVYVPQLGAPTTALLLGILLGNTFLRQKRFNKGTQFVESYFLAGAIVLLGGTLQATTMLELGWQGLTFVALQMLGTIMFTLWLGKRYGVSDDYRYLMASGNAVCGSSAIAATAKAMNVNDQEQAKAMTVVNMSGAILLFVAPTIAVQLWDDPSLHATFIGGILQSIGQVAASGSLLGHDVMQEALLVKMVRVIMLAPVVFLLVRWRKRSANVDRQFVGIPWFIFGFFTLMLLRSTGVITDELALSFKSIGQKLELIALAAIGMRVRFSELWESGPSLLRYAFAVMAMQIILALILLYSLF